MNDRPRIMFLITGLSKGGAETQLVRLAGELRRRNWEVSIASMDGSCFFRDELATHDVAFFPLDFDRSRLLNFLPALRHTRKLLREWNPDLLVTFMYHANLLGSLLTAIDGIPTVSSVRNEKFGGVFRETLAWLSSRVNVRTTINSSNAATRLVDRGVLPAGKTTVIPNAITVGPPRTSNTATADDILEWIAVGRLYPQKDYPNLLHAFSIVVSQQPNHRLSIAGSGPLQSEIENVVLNLNLSSHVTLLGQRNDVADLLRKSDALVLSSAWEGMPNVVMEAMANGVPVVATNVGGVSELVTDGITGFLCPPHNPEALATAMLALAGQAPAVKHDFGETGRQLIAKKFSVEAVSDLWESLISETIRESSTELSLNPWGDLS